MKCSCLKPFTQAVGSTAVSLVFLSLCLIELELVFFLVRGCVLQKSLQLKLISYKSFILGCVIIE